MSDRTRKRMTYDEVRAHASRIREETDGLNPAIFTAIDDLVGEGMWTGDVDPPTTFALDKAIEDVIASLITNGVDLVDISRNLLEDGDEPPEVIEAHGATYVLAEDAVTMTVEPGDLNPSYADGEPMPASQRATNILNRAGIDAEHYHSGGGIWLCRVGVVGDAFIFIGSAEDFNASAKGGYAVGLYRTYEDEGDVSIAETDVDLVKLVREGSAKLDRECDPIRHVVDVLGEHEVSATVIDQGDAGLAAEVLIGNGHSRVVVTRGGDYYLVGSYTQTPATGEAMVGSIDTATSDDGLVTTVREHIARLA